MLNELVAVEPRLSDGETVAIDADDAVPLDEPDSWEVEVPNDKETELSWLLKLLPDWEADGMDTVGREPENTVDDRLLVLTLLWDSVELDPADWLATDSLGIALWLLDPVDWLAVETCEFAGDEEAWLAELGIILAAELEGTLDSVASDADEDWALESVALACD